MRSLYKVIMTVAMFAMLAAPAMAEDPACVNLCQACTPGDSTCNKIEAACQCKMLLDSIKSVNTAIEINQRKLAKEIFAGCDKPTCARSITFENGIFKKMEKGRTPLSKLELTTGVSDAAQRAAQQLPLEIKAARFTVDSLTRRQSVLPIAPMSMECTDHCKICADSTLPIPTMTPVNAQAPAPQPAPAAPSAQPAPAPEAAADSAAASDTTAKATPVPAVDSAAIADSIAKAAATQRKAFCQLTESKCQCKAHEQNERDIVSLDSVLAIRTSRLDSLEKNRPEILRTEMARSMADQVREKCKAAAKCSYTVTFTNKELALLEMHDTALDTVKPAPAPEPESQATAEPEPAATSADTAAPAPAEACIQPEAAPVDSAAEAEKAKKEKERRIFYKAMEITYGKFGENDYYNIDLGRVNNLHGNGLEIGIAYLLRFYFYDGGAFSIGLGTFYHYNVLEPDSGYYTEAPDFKITYHNAGLEMPVSFRLGAPVVPILKPFVSETFTMRWNVVEVFKVEGLEDEDENAIDPFSGTVNMSKMVLGDWDYSMNRHPHFEYAVWLGFGIEITHHLSIEYQLNMGYLTTGHSHNYDADKTWRIVADFAW